MLIDFSDALQVNVYTLGTCFLKFRRLLGLKLAILDPALYIYRFAAHLDLDDKANMVALTALRLVGRMKRDWIVAGRRPAGICAAALLIASRAHGFSRHSQDVTRILRVCGMTVTNRVKEFEKTPSASLTLQQFNRVDLENEADPPAFTKNRIMEARARAIQDKNIDLLTSGALDDPMKSKKHTSKWRDGQSSEKTEAFEKLYKSLEVDIFKKKNGKSDEEETEGIDDGDDVDGDDGDDGKQKSKDTNGDEQEDKAGDKGASLESEKEDHDNSSANDDVKQVATTTNLAEAKWDKAYPKNSYGKKIVLPDHATPEERLPPTQPVEGTLDTSYWRKDMPQNMIEDIESIFRNPTEVAQKEAIFNKINKDYIIVQAQKEKSRTAAEQANTTADKDMIEQTQGMERYRKRKGRGKDGTTEEALLEVVANRKISRKINYDAMSSIFDDGSFSTGGAEIEDPFATREKIAAEEV